MKYYILLIIYFICINLIAAVITISDKHRAVKNKSRISENTLFFISLLGGGIGMYLTMVTISHKTRHKKFMVGIPIITIIEAVVLITAYNLVRIYG